MRHLVPGGGQRTQIIAHGESSAKNAECPPDSQHRPRACLRSTRPTGRPITEAPYAAISFTGPNEQWCKAEYGWTLGTIPRDQSPCAISVERGSPLIVENAQKHEDIRHLAPVTEVGIRFYAGFPFSANNQTVGALCVAGPESQSLNDSQIELLEGLASQAGVHLENRYQINQLKEENAELLIQELGAEMAEEKYRSIFDHVQEEFSKLQRMANLFRRTQCWRGFMDSIPRKNLSAK